MENREEIEDALVVRDRPVISSFHISGPPDRRVDSISGACRIKQQAVVSFA
jgi:hypothetical protein